MKQLQTIEKVALDVRRFVPRPAGIMKWHEDHTCSSLRAVRADEIRAGRKAVLAYFSSQDADMNCSLLRDYEYHSDLDCFDVPDENVESKRVTDVQQRVRRHKRTAVLWNRSAE